MNAPIARIVEEDPSVFSLTRWESLGRLLSTARNDGEQIEFAHSIMLEMLKLPLDAYAHNPILEAKGALESARDEEIDERVNNVVSGFGDYRCDEIRNDGAY